MDNPFPPDFSFREIVSPDPRHILSGPAAAVLPVQAAVEAELLRRRLAAGHNPPPARAPLTGVPIPMGVPIPAGGPLGPQIDRLLAGMRTGAGPAGVGVVGLSGGDVVDLPGTAARGYDAGGGGPDSGYIIPPHRTFATIWGGTNQAYWAKFDDALRTDQTNALAMQRDAQLYHLRRSRALPTALLDFKITPDDPKDKGQADVADQFSKIIAATRRFQALKLYLLDSAFFGKYGGQCLYGKKMVDGRLRTVVRRHTPVNGDKIVYHWDGTPGILVRTGSQWEDRAEKWVGPSGTIGMALWLRDPFFRDRFVIHEFEPYDPDYLYEGDQAAAIHGLGFRGRLYWEWWLRNEFRSYECDGLQRMSTSGTWFAFYPAGNEAARVAAIAALKLATRDNAAAFPVEDTQGFKPDSIIKNIPPSNIAYDVINQAITYIDDLMRQVILGQNLSSESAPTGLGSGVAELHKDTFANIIRFDAQSLGETLTEDLLPPLLKMNVFEYRGRSYPGDRLPFGMKLEFVTEREDVNEKIDTASKLVEMGVALDTDDLRDQAGFQAPKAGAIPVGGPAGGVAGAPGPGGVLQMSPGATPGGNGDGKPSGGGNPGGNPPSGGGGGGRFPGPSRNAREGRPISPPLGGPTGEVIRYGHAHAPEGGVTIKGQHFEGGQFIPETAFGGDELAARVARGKGVETEMALGGARWQRNVPTPSLTKNADGSHTVSAGSKSWTAQENPDWHAHEADPENKRLDFANPHYRHQLIAHHQGDEVVAEGDERYPILAGAKKLASREASNPAASTWGFDDSPEPDDMHVGHGADQGGEVAGRQESKDGQVITRVVFPDGTARVWLEQGENGLAGQGEGMVESIPRRDGKVIVREWTRGPGKQPELTFSRAVDAHEAPTLEAKKIKAWSTGWGFGKLSPEVLGASPRGPGAGDGPPEERDGGDGGSADGPARHRREHGPVRYAAVHAPAGGATVAGKKFKGGEFIPGDVLARATPAERAAVDGASGASSAVKSPASPVPPAVPKISPAEREDPAEILATARKLLGSKATMADLAALTGSTPDASIKVFERGGYLRLDSEGDGWNSVRLIQRDDDGRVFIHNHLLTIDEDKQGGGIGVAIFGNQVREATARGVAYLDTTAERGEKFVGYKVWPKFGYDAPIPAALIPHLPPELDYVENISELMYNNGGREWWEEHGVTTDMKFDLGEESDSLAVWNAYRQERAARKDNPPAKPVAPGGTPQTSPARMSRSPMGSGIDLAARDPAGPPGSESAPARMSRAAGDRLRAALAGLKSRSRRDPGD